MIRPKDVTTKRHPIRDAAICNEFLRGTPVVEIASKFNLSVRAINWLLSENRACLKLDKEYSKVRRVMWLESQVVKRGDSRKDSADLVAQIKDEMEDVTPTAQVGISIVKVIANLNQQKDKLVERGELDTMEALFGKRNGNPD